MKIIYAAFKNSSDQIVTVLADLLPL